MTVKRIRQTPNASCMKVWTIEMVRKKKQPPRVDGVAARVYVYSCLCVLFLGEHEYCSAVVLLEEYFLHEILNIFRCEGLLGFNIASLCVFVPVDV